MSQPFSELRERLLRAGVAPRHVRRYLRELSDHLADLTAEEERAGRNLADARAAALARLGTIDDLALAMIEQPQFQSWSARVPWLVFTLAPLVFLAATYFIACFILWSGWQIFLPGSSTPFIRVDGPAILYFYFGVGRTLYIYGPVLIGWAIALLAIRQRLSWLWPTIGFLILALMGTSARVHVARPVGAIGHVSMSFTLLSANLSDTLFRLCFILVVAALPYLIWRIQSRQFTGS